MGPVARSRVKPLREALAARPDDDFVVSAPVRRKAVTQARKPRKAAAAERVLSFASSHPRGILSALFLAGCGSVIAWNALVMQRVQHPAPLFNPKEVTAGPASSTVRPLPPSRPASEPPEPQASASAQQMPIQQAQAPASAAAPKLPPKSAIAELIRTGEPTVAAPSQPRSLQPNAPAAPVATAKAPAARDPIAEMIRMGGPVPTPPANVGRPEAGDLILGGQRALAKLGYGVKPDGVMGTGTRQAIERFEQDRRLPVTGEFGPRTARELSALSGIQVQP